MGKKRTEVHHRLPWSPLFILSIFQLGLSSGYPNQDLRPPLKTPPIPSAKSTPLPFHLAKQSLEKIKLWRCFKMDFHVTFCFYSSISPTLLIEQPRFLIKNDTILKIWDNIETISCLCFLPKSGLNPPLNYFSIPVQLVIWNYKILGQD